MLDRGNQAGYRFFFSEVAKDIFFGGNALYDSYTKRSVVIQWLKTNLSVDSIQTRALTHISRYGKSMYY